MLTCGCGGVTPREPAGRAEASTCERQQGRHLSGAQPAAHLHPQVPACLVGLPEPGLSV